MVPATKIGTQTGKLPRTVTIQNETHNGRSPRQCRTMKFHRLVGVGMATGDASGGSGGWRSVISRCAGSSIWRRWSGVIMELGERAEAGVRILPKAVKSGNAVFRNKKNAPHRGAQFETLIQSVGPTKG